MKLILMWALFLVGVWLCITKTEIIALGVCTAVIGGIIYAIIEDRTTWFD